ncbi:MAG TPA: hypothetical protein VJB94_01240 [Candidatus Nanoarchaeia archaeon]|nr:hypothetical protein [Candidatus Nanoarchaeia archaeon]
MLTLNDIQKYREIKKILNSKNIELANINSKIFHGISKDNYLNIKFYTPKEWNNFKKTEIFSRVLNDLIEGYRLGYGNKSLAVILSLKYKICISHQIIYRTINKFKLNRFEYSFNDKIFEKANTILKGRIIYNKIADSMYLTFKCNKIRDLPSADGVGVKIVYSNNLESIFLERDDRSKKKINVHKKGDLFVSLYPVPKSMAKLLLNTRTSYSSIFIDIHIDSNNFGLKREELIQDRDARILYPELEKLGFLIAKNRTTCTDRSKGDIVLYKDEKKLILEISTLGENSNAKHKYSQWNKYRDFIIGKIIRIVTVNDAPVIFILNKKLKEKAFNEDFNKIVEKYLINIIITDFKNNWESEVAKKVNSLFERI